MNNLIASLRRIKDIIKKDVDITDRTGRVLYSSDSARAGKACEEAELEGRASLDSRRRFYVNIPGGSYEEVNLAVLILKDKVEGTAGSRQQFLINILDGMDGEDIERYCREYGIPINGAYTVCLIRLLSDEHFKDAFSLVSNSFYGEEGLWVLPYDSDIVVVENTDSRDEPFESNAHMIRDMINSEIYAGAHVGVGSTHTGAPGIRDSLLEAREAIRVGRLFNIPEDIYVYRNILLERIIDRIPQDKIEEAAGDILGRDMDTLLHGEMVNTVEVFFKNNLNISDSARILYIHRNTLLYRLDKIQKVTGLDIRKFEDAVVFKLVYLLKIRRKT
jgi:carbohydrate diacid regulator